MTATAPFESAVGNARFTAAQLDATMRRIPPITDMPLVVYLHGAGGNAAQALTGFYNITYILNRLVSLGFPVVAPSTGDNWGNTTTISRITDAITWGRANLGASSAPPILYGASMGGNSCLAYAISNPVSCVACHIPAVDIQDAITNDTLSLRASINAAWGRAAGDTSTLPAGANPSTMTTALSQVHQQHWYATNDAVSNNIATYAAAVGCDLRAVGALGHSAQAIDAASAADIIKFIGHHCRVRLAA